MQKCVISDGPQCEPWVEGTRYSHMISNIWYQCGTFVLEIHWTALNNCVFCQLLILFFAKKNQHELAIVPVTILIIVIFHNVVLMLSHQRHMFLIYFSVKICHEINVIYGFKIKELPLSSISTQYMTIFFNLITLNLMTIISNPSESSNYKRVPDWEIFKNAETSVTARSIIVSPVGL